MSRPTHIPSALRPQPTINGFDEFEVIGRGGFATVFKAFEPAFGRHVAIKLVHLEDVADDVGARFERECRAVGTLSGHPNIVTVYGAGTTATGQPYLVMELVEGGSLGKRLKTKGPMGPDEAVAIGIPLLEAVAASHAKRILHRDIKPDNVLITVYGQPQLADFGISSIPGGYETGSGQVSATMAYAAPEVINGEPASQSSDIYSLAATLVSLIIGDAPIPRQSGELVLPYINRLLNESPPSLQAYGASTELDDVLRRALAKLPVDRFETAQEFRDALRASPEARHIQRTEPQPTTVAPVPSEAVTQRSTQAEADRTVIKGLPPEDPATYGSSPANHDQHRNRRTRPRSILAAALIVSVASATGVWVVDRHRGEPAAAATKTVPAPIVAVPAVEANCLGLVCSFVATQTGRGEVANSWSWSFGDSAVMNGPASVTHTYARPGDYRLALTVGADEQTSDAKPVTIAIASVARGVKVTAGAAGPLQIAASVTAPAMCGRASFIVQKNVAGQWLQRSRGNFGAGVKIITVTSPGAYRVTLPTKSVSNAVCGSIRSRSVTVAPAPTAAVANPTSSSGSSSHSSKAKSSGGGKPIHPPITG